MSEAKRLKALEGKNATLKKFLLIVVDDVARECLAAIPDSHADHHLRGCGFDRRQRDDPFGVSQALILPLSIGPRDVWG